MTPQITAGCLVRIDVTIDGLVADIDGSCDLLWAELLLKLFIYVVPDLCLYSWSIPAAFRADVRQMIGLFWTITVKTSIASYLPINLDLCRPRFRAI